MILNLKTTKLISTSGEQLVEVFLDENKQEVKKEVQLKNLIILALRQPIEGEKEKSIKDKDFLILCKFLGDSETIELESEDISRIKEKCSYMFDCFVSGQIGLILEGKPLKI
jgi:hypothetical protein